MLCVWVFSFISGGVCCNNMGSENLIVSVNTFVFGTICWYGSLDLVLVVFAVNIYCQKKGGSRCLNGKCTTAVF